MKSFIIYITISLLLISPLIAQIDSAGNLNNVSCTITRTFLIKDINTDKITYKTYLQDIESIKYLGFFNDDSISVKSGSDSVYRLNINHLKELNISCGNYSIAGCIIGAAAGMVAGYLIGSSAKFEGAGYTFSEGWTGPVGILIGTPLGGLVGFIIGSSINDYKTLNLNEIFHKNKKGEVLKFLRQK